MRTLSTIEVEAVSGAVSKSEATAMGIGGGAGAAAGWQLGSAHLATWVVRGAAIGATTGGIVGAAIGVVAGAGLALFMYNVMTDK